MNVDTFMAITEKSSSPFIFLLRHLWWKAITLAPLKRYYLPNPFARAGYDTRSVFKRSLTGLNSEISFSKTRSLTKAEEPSLPYYIPIAGGRIFGFIPFPRVLVLWEMQSVRSRIWTRVAVSISCDDNHYTTGTSIQTCLLEWSVYCACNKAEEPSPSYYLPIAGGRIRGFIPFPRVFARKWT